MLLTPAVQTIRHEIDQRLNPGYRHAEPARLLADAYALALATAEKVDDLALKRDSLDVAVSIEEFLLDTLSECRVSKADVEGQFEELREEHPWWPEELDAATWAELAETRTLRDITDVLCDGGDYWEAIRVGVLDVLETRFPAESDPEFQPRTLYFALESEEWRELHRLIDSIDGYAAGRIREVLFRVQNRTARRFAMVVWSEQDVLDAVARERDEEFGPMDEASWEQAGVTKEWVEDVMESAHGPVRDRMTEIGWEILESVISDAGLPEREGG